MAKSKKMLEGEGWSFEPADKSPPERETNSLPPEMQKAKLTLEKRPKGKNATVLTGFVLSDNDRKKLAATLKKGCGTGGSESPGHIEIQGDHRDAIRKLLTIQGWKIR